MEREKEKKGIESGNGKEWKKRRKITGVETDESRKEKIKLLKQEEKKQR